MLLLLPSLDSLLIDDDEVVVLVVGIEEWREIVKENSWEGDEAGDMVVVVT